MNDIAFHGTLDQETYAGAVRGTKSMRKAMIVLSIILIAFILQSAIFGSWRTWGPAILLCAMWLLLLWLASGTQVGKHLAANKTLQGPIRGVARESGIEIVTDYTTANYPWHVLHHHELAGDTMLLYLSPAIAHFLPRTFFGSDAEWDAFRALVAGNVPAKVRQGGNTVVKTAILWMIIVIAVFLLWSVAQTH
jgi:hypothetical protein